MAIQIFQNKDIEWATETVRANGPRYERTQRYYEGRHDLAYATEKFQNTFGSLFREFALNLCPVICDALRDKLRVRGFSTEEGGQDANVRQTTRRIWQRNRMGSRASELHKEALKSGDAYAILWPSAEGRAVIYPNQAANIAVRYDDESPGRVTCAAKIWRTEDKRVRLNLFYPDRIEKYISKDKAEGTLPDAGGFTAFRDAEIRGSKAASVVRNPFGVVPVFHFANNADIGMPGRSELEAAMPVQDGLNKSVLDMLVAMEFSAYRQRWAAGIEIEYDNEGRAAAPFKAGVDHLWIAENPSAKFGDFEAAALDQFLKVKDGFRADIAAVTGTPLHYFMQEARGFPSGESLRKAESRFLAKARDRQDAFGQTWADLMAFAARIETGNQELRLVTEWEDHSPISERERLENLLLKKQLGLPLDKALVEAGYGVADVAQGQNNKDFEL